MGKKKKKDKALEKFGLGSSVFLFLVSWTGAIVSALLFTQELIEVIGNNTAKGLFFLPLYFVMVVLYVLLTLAFAGRINRIKKEERLKKKKGKKK